MDQSNQIKESYSIKPGSLGTAERLVYEVLTHGLAKDLAKIAKLCNLTDLQVIVAVQLLMNKQLLPTEKLLSHD